MTDFLDMLNIGLEVVQEVAAVEITYHRDAQELECTAIRGATQIRDEEEIRDPERPELHTIDWRIQAEQLADLEDPTGNDPDWLEDSLGNRFTVIPPTGDVTGWDYITDDQTWIRLRTWPQEIPPD